MSALEVPSHTRREWIDARVKRSWLAKLAPPVEWIADLLDRRAGVRDDPIWRAPPFPGAVRLRPVTRKVLLFDYKIKLPIVIAGIFVGGLIVEDWGLNGLAQSYIETGGINDLTLTQFVRMSFMVCVMVIGCVLAMGHRLHRLRQVLARCVVVTARVLATTSQNLDDLGTWAAVRVEYLYGGVLYTSYVSLWLQPSGLIGSAPELLVDTQMPTEVLIRDFYT